MRNLFWILITFVLLPIFYIRIFCNKLFKNKELRILVIETAKIGDLVCATPVFRAIKEKFPNSYLVAGIGKESYGVVQNNPHIDKCIFLNIKDFKTTKLIKEISKEKFSLSINLGPTALNTILGFWAGIPERITSISKFTGKTAKLFSFLSNHRLEYKQHTSKLRHNLELLKYLGIRNFSEKKEVFIKEEEEQKAKRFLQKNNIKESDLTIGIATTAGNKIKEWELYKFKQLADKLKKELNAKVIFIRQDYFKLNELAAFLKKLKLFISVDTGPLYIAHAVGTPVVDITGPCDINEQPPRDNISELVFKELNCWPCSFVIPPARKCRRGDFACIKKITVEDVFRAIKKILKRLYGINL